MASPAQITANQANANQSTGPKTAEGKSTASTNAIRHGLTSKRVVLPGESQEQFDKLVGTLRVSYSPANSFEEELVERIAQSYWRLQRAQSVETALLSNRIEAIIENADADDAVDALALIFTDKAESAKVRLFMRYLAAAERSYNKAVSELRQIQKERIKNEKAEAMLEMLTHQAMSESYEAPLPVGFVSHLPAKSENTDVSSASKE